MITIENQIQREDSEGPVAVEIARNEEGAPTPVPEEEEFSYDYEEVDGEYYDEEDAIEEEGQNAVEANEAW